MARRTQPTSGEIVPMNNQKSPAVLDGDSDQTNAFNRSQVMKSRLNFLGKVVMGYTENRLSREHVEEVLKSELRTQSLALMHKHGMDLSFIKTAYTAQIGKRITDMEKDIIEQEGIASIELSRITNNHLAQHRAEYHIRKEALDKERAAGLAEDWIYEKSLAELREQYTDASDACMDRMKLYTESHLDRVEKTLISTKKALEDEQSR